MAESIESAARAYVDRGWRVIPLYESRDGRCACGADQCFDVGKHPRIALGQGLVNASCDWSVVSRWLTKWPTLNLGIATGARSQINVLDVDFRAGGDDSLRFLEREHGALPATVQAQTGFGVHIYFAYGESWRTRASSLGDGLDIRSDGGYVVAPPSQHFSGRQYTWIADMDPGSIPLAVAPEWLVKAAQSDRGGAAGPPRQRGEVIRVDKDQLLRMALARVGENGHRNDTGFWLACQLRDHGLDLASCKGVLEAFVARCASMKSWDHGYGMNEALKSLGQAFGRRPRGPMAGPARQEPAPEPAPASKPPDPAPAPPPEPAPEGVVERPSVRLISPADFLRERDRDGRRWPLGIQVIDQHIRGGVPRGKVVTVTGRPGAGKTNLVTQFALGLSRAGCDVYCFWRDEGNMAATVRFAQMLGCDRALLEDCDPGEERRALKMLDGLSLRCLSGARGTFKAMLEMVEASPSDRQVVLVLDSVQTISGTSGGSGKQQWERINEFAVMLRELVDRTRWIAVCCSQATRGSYRSRREEDHDDPLASPGGGSGIEYQSDLMLYLLGSLSRGVKVKIPKNRIGGDESDCRLMFDKERCIFRGAIDEAAPDVDAAAAVAKKRILKNLLEVGGELSTNQLFQAVGGSRGVFNEALLSLEREVLVFKSQGPRGSWLWEAARGRRRDGDEAQ